MEVAGVMVLGVRVVIVVVAEIDVEDASVIPNERLKPWGTEGRDVVVVSDGSLVHTTRCQ